jgi:uncharacterized RDD family membrane protein YckC
MKSLEKAFTKFRLRRLAAFIIDMGILVMLLTLFYKLFEFPNFPVVMAAMVEANSKINTPEWQSLVNSSSAIFNIVFIQSLLIYFGYETVTQILFRGSTIGKLAMRLRIVPQNSNRGLVFHYLFMTVRSFIKIILIYLLQGIPFIISVLSIFANYQSKAGYDYIVKTVVVEKVKGKDVEDEKNKLIKRDMIADAG